MARARGWRTNGEWWRICGECRSTANADRVAGRWQIARIKKAAFRRQPQVYRQTLLERMNREHIAHLVSDSFALSLQGFNLVVQVSKRRRPFLGGHSWLELAV